MFFSPKTSADGLVFHYDTGNTVRSYLGEPTVNLYEGLMNLPASWSIGPNTSYVGTTEGPFPGTVGYKYSVLGSGNFYLIYSKSGLTPNTTYTVSVYVKMIVGTSTQNNGVLYSADYNAGIPPSTNITSEWKRIHYTFTLGANSTYANVVLFGYDNAVGNILAYSLPQLEQKSHPTQHIDGTRSVTQGLKDLTAANTINLSNVSFDSNAQMNFDGTDDYIDVGDLGTIGSSYSLECVFKSTSVTSYKNIFDMNYATYSGVTGNTGPRLEQISGQGISIIWSGNTSNNNLYNATPPINISANTYYHLAFVQNGTFGAIYLNGTLRDQANNAQGYLQTFGDFNIGRGFILDPSRYFSGNVDMFKIFNRALTTDEVTRNYNAIKSRFNIG